MNNLPAPSTRDFRHVVAHRFGRHDAMGHQYGRQSPLRAHVFVMSLLFGAALAVAYILLPGDGERIAMLERDGKTREARLILEGTFNAGDRRQRTLFQLEGLYEQSGNLPKTRQMLELLGALRPRDGAVQRQLGQFYRQTQDEKAYVRSLIQQIELRYSEAACREVVGLLRRQGAWGEEQAMLQRCRQKGYRRPDDMIRFASLLAADGDMKEASLLLRSVDDLRKLKTERERLQLFQILLDLDQPGEAQRRAVRWVKGSKDDAFTLTLIGTLVTESRFDAAIELARETSVPGDGVFLSIAEVMVERNQMQAARAILRGWLDKATAFDASVIVRFVRAAVASGDLDVALRAAQKIGLVTLPADATVQLARALAADGRKLDADALMATIDPASAERVATPDRKTGRFSRSGAVTRIANLEVWRRDLWTRLREQNRPVAAVAVPPGAAKSLREKQLTALKRARKLAADRAKFGGNKGKPGGTGNPPFNFFDVKPGG